MCSSKIAVALYYTLGYARAIPGLRSDQDFIGFKPDQFDKSVLPVMVNHGLLDWKIFGWLLSIHDRFN